MLEVFIRLFKGCLIGCLWVLIGVALLTGRKRHCSIASGPQFWHPPGINMSGSPRFNAAHLVKEGKGGETRGGGDERGETRGERVGEARERVGREEKINRFMMNQKKRFIAERK